VCDKQWVAVFTDGSDDVNFTMTEAEATWLLRPAKRDIPAYSAP
jgi:hypothetical protein